MISEPKEPDEAQEQKLRNLIERHAAYAESGPTFDPSGKYLCGQCAFHKGTEHCAVVEGRISLTVGTCRLWDSTKLPDDARPRKLSQLDVGYSERPEDKGFGCSPRCEYGSKAKRPDSEGRQVWCGFWGLHVIAKACCSEEDGPDLILAPGESKSNNEE